MGDSLVPPEALAAIGRTAEERTGVVYKKEFQRWAASVGDLNPLYFDEGFALAHGHPDVVMPPMFLSHVFRSYVVLDQLRPDGIPRSGVSMTLPLPGRMMAGGEETRFLQPIYPGDALTATRKLADLAEKHGRSGAFVLITWNTTITRDDGDVVAHTVGTSIAR